MKRRLVLITVLGVAALASTVHEISVAAGRKTVLTKSDAAAAPLVPTTSFVRAEGHVVTYPGASVTVGTEVQGTVISLPVKEKDFVRKGELVAILRADDNRAALSLAEARVAQDETDVRLYQVEAVRQQSLWQQGVGTRRAFDRAQHDFESAQARCNTDAQDVRRMKAVVAKTVIHAPISGVVTSRMVQPGEIVMEGASLISLADLRRTRIEAEVDEFDAGRVKLGQEVDITAEGYDGQLWRGRVEEIPDTVERRQIKPQDPAAPTDTRVLLLKIALLERTPLKLNQRVQVAIETGR